MHGRGPVEFGLDDGCPTAKVCIIWQKLIYASNLLYLFCVSHWCTICNDLLSLQKFQSQDWRGVQDTYLDTFVTVRLTFFNRGKLASNRSQDTASSAVSLYFDVGAFAAITNSRRSCGLGNGKAALERSIQYSLSDPGSALWPAVPNNVLLCAFSLFFAPPPYRSGSFLPSLLSKHHVATVTTALRLVQQCRDESKLAPVSL
jgi:hypothetical protein